MPLETSGYAVDTQNAVEVMERTGGAASRLSLELESIVSTDSYPLKILHTELVYIMRGTTEAGELHYWTHGTPDLTGAHSGTTGLTNIKNVGTDYIDRRLL